ncbi:hypothetical protein A2856_04035 [Candidatus Uhrbacteria bacterium RIFCSPHIGHO2_01_FULL_63_20]|uniref:Antitoxin n=1 Tax=Candidatus Uhrbacteria bacterium RIFCSPHIGHO2_01_FULL_63_20 TaxID=1802385 RepID=A0A1F7TMJ0_9BACT|nr:MAG: hypothetical protein A2856_04035 [Candidatus Uhrbacteria bacterium RIFCSPHIGHO2_01_FULL_63_20]
MKNLRRLLELAKRTGDRLIITDPEGEESFVVMGLDQYEGLLGGPRPSERPLPTPPTPAHRGPTLRQDRDRATSDEDETPPPDIFDLMKPANEAGDTWDLAKMNDVERHQVLKEFMAFQEGDSIPEAEKEGRNKAKNEGFDEDQFYLEPVE